VKVTREPAVAGWKTCNRDHKRDGFCRGYKSMPASIVVEVVAWTFVDRGGDDGRVENTHEYRHPATPDDAVCDFCHGPVNLTLLPAVEYDRLGPDGPLDLIRAAAEEREHENRMLAADERSAAAHERSADLQERAVLASERANELRAIELGLNGNVTGGHDSPPSEPVSGANGSPPSEPVTGSHGSTAKPRKRTEA
jgi:hypothetical protein